MNGIDPATHLDEDDDDAPKTDIDLLDEIGTEAFEKAKAIVDARVTELFARRPDRYESFAFMVGWGVVLYDPDGRKIEPEAMDAKEKAVFDLARYLEDNFGLDNSRIMAADVEPAPQTAWWGAGQADEMEVYVIRMNDDPRAGQPEDLQVRPVSKGIGEPMMTVAPYDLTTDEGEPFVFYQPAPRPTQPTRSGPSFG